MSELDDGKISKDLWDFSVERGHIDIEKHPIGVLGAGLRSYVATLEAKLEAMERLLSDKYVQWGWDGKLPMEFGFCYLCGRDHTQGHLTTCDFATIAAAQQEEK